MKRVCKICGTPEEEHHEPDWLEIPDGCVCDLGGWNTHAPGFVMPPVCSEYKGDGNCNCETCEHDKDCHVNGKEQP